MADVLVLWAMSPGCTYPTPEEFDATLDEALEEFGIGERSHDVNVAAATLSEAATTFRLLIDRWLGSNFYRLIDLTEQMPPVRPSLKEDLYFVFGLMKRYDRDPALVLFAGKTEEEFWTYLADEYRSHGVSVKYRLG